MQEFNHKVAVITGAASGIGRAIAEKCLDEGMQVVLADVEEDALARTVDEFQSTGKNSLIPVRTDVSQLEDIERLAQTTLDTFGGVHLLFNNAVYQGTGNVEPLLEVAEDQLRAIYQGNVFTPLTLVKTFLPSMLEQGSGTIMNMVSLSAFTNPPAAGDKGGWGFAYPSSKAAVARMAGSLRAEHPKAGLRVFNLEPGTVMTEVMRMLGIDEAVMARYKPCSPATIAAVVAWLADNDPSPAWEPEDVLHGPAIAKELKLLQAPSLLDN